MHFFLFSKKDNGSVPKYSPYKKQLFLLMSQIEPSLRYGSGLGLGKKGNFVSTKKKPIFSPERMG